MNEWTAEIQCNRALSPAIYFGMNTGRSIGLVGGLGVGAAVRYYCKLAEAHERQGARRGSAEMHERLTELAQTLMSRDGVEAILLAGTDLTLLFNESNTRFPAIDCAALHLSAIEKAALPRADSSADVAG
jgi:aspartate/glutamate racemase